MDNKEKLLQLERSDLPFCAFSLPGSKEINIILQRDADVESPRPEGMVMAPYIAHEENPTIYIRPDFLGPLNTLDLFDYEYMHFEDSGYGVELYPRASRAAYLERCEDLVDRLRSGEGEKAVLSIVDPRPYNGTYTDIFLQAAADYEKAFVYFLQAPGVYTGIGASPEVLLERQEDTCRSMSLAGTRRKGGEPWTDKEREEQDIVTRYILEELTDAGIEDIEYSDAYDDEAGPLVHLRSDILFRTDKNDREVLDILHPTPAVCGQPLDKAKALIAELEEHDRRYYTGYIGISGGRFSRYFVNLRCIEKKDYYALCYAGGGITASSEPESEWQELVNKLEVMGRFLPEYRD